MVGPELSHLLRFRPWPPGDPVPEIWDLIRELEADKQRQVGATIVRTQIAMDEARIAGLKQIAEVLAASKAR